ncbi:cysteine desulfurase / selenocysteine lyase [Friedmanniella luteola]|uniref:cysteine desulfurase n=1 Tax=Friedmanniella luteola TaxID=546871 RepID=A0A1H1PNE4_9ACTN|nr:cysteine desulfurase / selenocysteine lyase [Friedmanniella luteola]
MTTEVEAADRLPEYAPTVPVDEAPLGALGDEPIPFAVEAIRADFPILERTAGDWPLVYLDSANTSQKPRVVVEAIEDHYLNHNANVARAMHLLGGEATEAFEGARATLANFVGAARSEEIVFTKNASEALNLCAHTLGARLRPGDEIVISVMEHHSNIVPWQLLAERTGAVLRWYDVTEDGRLDLEGAVRDGLLNERTKIVSVVHVSNVLGTVNPVAQIAAAAHAVGAVVVVDASQSVPQMPVDVQALGADLLVFTGHKMVGPTGIGVLWGRYDLLAELPPFLGGGEMIEVVKMSGSTFAPPPHRFEAGTPPIAQAVGLATAASYLSDLGLDQIAAHEQDITAYALQGLAGVPGLRVVGPAEPVDRGGAISFTLGDIHPHDVSQLLDSRGIAVRGGHHCARPLHERFGVQSSTRASFYLYTTRAEIDALVDGLDYTVKFFARGSAAPGPGRAR